MSAQSSWRRFLLVVTVAAVLTPVVSARTAAPQNPGSRYSTANTVPGEPLDEAFGGRTLKGTPITRRIPECFPAESRDLFWQMDMVPGKDGALQPLNFDANNDGRIDDAEGNAIRGRNTWVLWAGGNEGFWNWLVQDGYGFTDFLVLLDSRARDSRFKRAGLISQPGYQSNADPARRILGLYLDTPASFDSSDGYGSAGHALTSPPWDADAKRAERPASHGKWDLFEPGDPAAYADTVRKLQAIGDGVDYTVYGYPSGIVGLRLFLNPDFFGTGDGPERARQYWKTRVEDTHDRYYTDASILRDTALVRPFRVGMSCGFCHVGPHPLNPPRNPEDPEWANLSSNIGNQYWRPQAAFANLQQPNSFLYHFIASQLPGTIDTSLVSTDHINNANTINAVFEINPRLARAGLNPAELQSAGNVLLKSIEDPGLAPKRDGTDLRHTPRVLIDGSDSIGAFGALARVYLNIGTFYEEWLRCHNALIGFTEQRPFALDVCQRNSVYWQANERYRGDYLAAFFTMKHAASNQPPRKRDGVASAETPAAVSHTSTQPMKLASAREANGETQSTVAASYLALDTAEQRKRGREVWLRGCAICHSSKQPDGFALTFAGRPEGTTWSTQPAPKEAHYALPANAADWVAFKQSPAYGDYTKRLLAMVTAAGQLTGDPLSDEHAFWKDNYLATDIRVPVTLASTPPGRALASNAIAHNVWDNFSSTTYKELPPVGQLSFYNPIDQTQGTFQAPGGGRGYYRPATHVSLWATAPFLHNNALGVYLTDPSVKGRLVQFADGIRRMLWQDRRSSRSLALSPAETRWLDNVKESGDPDWGNYVVTRLGDLRGQSQAAAADPGFIYRLPQDTTVEFAPPYVQPLVEGILGGFATSVLSTWIWVVLFVLSGWLAYKRKPRYVGIALLGGAILIAAVLALSGLGGGGGSGTGVLMMATLGLLEHSSWMWWLAAGVLAVSGIALVQARPGADGLARWLFRGLLAVGVLVAIATTESLWVGALAVLVAALLGWRIRPTLAGFSRWYFIALTIVVGTAGYAANSFIHGRALLTVPVANVSVGPFPVNVGPIPRGTPVNLVMNMDPESPHMARALLAMVLATADIKRQGLVGEQAWLTFMQRAGQPLMDASKCPDFVLDHGHLFGETLDPDPAKNDADKEALIAFLKTL